jgi:hypothetical protein
MKPPKKRNRLGEPVTIVTPKVKTRSHHMRRKLRPGQPNALSKLDNALEKKICGFIARGMVWEDACQLCGIHRKTAWDWKCRGDAGEPRYVQFLEKTSLAELRAKALLIGKIRNNPDWKAQKFLLCNRYPKEFRDHIVQEVTGPSGGSIPVAVNPFEVEIIMAGDPDPKFTTIDHRNEPTTTGRQTSVNANGHGV